MRYILHNILLLIVLLLALGTTAPLCFSADNEHGKTEFTDLIATTSETHVIFFGVITNSFSEDMIAGLQSGVPVDFHFSVELYQENDQEDDILLEALEFQHIMTYDTLKDSYRVELGEMNNRIKLFQSFEEAQETMSEINGLPVIALTQLIPQHTYRLQVRAKLFEKTLPMSLHRLLPFLSWWEKETSWHTLEFNY